MNKNPNIHTTLKRQQWQNVKTRRQNPIKFKMKSRSTNFLRAVVIFALLPYSSTLSLPSSDPAPGRSPGPPEDGERTIETERDKAIDVTESYEAANVEALDYDESTTSVEGIETTSDVGSASETDSDACAFARVPSDSDEVVTLSDDDSDVNLTVNHPVFDTAELVRGVVYDVHLEFQAPLRDYMLCSVIGNSIRGNFTPTTFAERPCRDETHPYFVPKHKNERTKRNKKHKNSNLNSKRTFGNGYRTKSVPSEFSYYFRPRASVRVERSVYRRFDKSARFRRRFLPARVVSGPLEGRRSVALQWSVTDARLEDEARVVFRCPYKTWLPIPQALDNSR